jgi:hypothetical protein
VPYFSLCNCFVRMTEEMIKLQSVYRTENLVFGIHKDKEMKETVLKVFIAQVEHLNECCNTNKEYNIDL